MEDSERNKEYWKLFNAKSELHKLMRRVIISTKLGRQEKEPDDDVYLNIGGGSLNSCSRYEQVRFYLNNPSPKGVYEEYEWDRDIESICYLLEEIKNRFSDFQKARNANKLEYVNGKKKFAERYFGKPFKIGFLSEGI